MKKLTSEQKDVLAAIATTNPITEDLICRAHAAGFIAKRNLKDGVSYAGSCRNADVAVWHAEKGCFTYLRKKWGDEFFEDINHFEDEEGYDVYIPFAATPGN
jgi:hypothetical protein